jgi:acid phosphatase family membrane protein YuiD
MHFEFSNFIQNSLVVAQNAAQNAAQSAYVDPPYCAVAPHGRGWQVILVTVFSSGFAQAIKLVTKLIKTGQLDMRILAKTGGMPSSHSCCTMGMAVSVGLIDGFNSITFAIALCLAFIVMYDAAGVRRTVGLQAKVLNQMMTELFSEHPRLSGERIKEFLGHTPVEVFVGAILGSLIAVVFNILAIHQHWHLD